MLVEADTIQKAKELKDLALTAKDWAKRKGLGEEAIATARRYALEAERRMGQMLGETERAVGTDVAGRQYVDGHQSLPSNPPPTLTALGITKKESSSAQWLAKLPDENFEDLREGKVTRSQAIQGVKHVSLRTGQRCSPK